MNGLQWQLNGLICIQKFQNKRRIIYRRKRTPSKFCVLTTKLQFKTNYERNLGPGGEGGGGRKNQDNQ